MTDVTVIERVKALAVLGAAAIAKSEAEYLARVEQRKKDEAEAFKLAWQTTFDAVCSVIPDWAREFVSLPSVKLSKTSYGVSINLPGDVVGIRADYSHSVDSVVFYVWGDYSLSRWQDCEDGSPWYVYSDGQPTEFNSRKYESAFAAAVAFASGKAFESKKAVQAKVDQLNESYRLEVAKLEEQTAAFLADTGHSMPVEPSHQLGQLIIWGRPRRGSLMAIFSSLLRLPWLKSRLPWIRSDLVCNLYKLFSTAQPARSTCWAVLLPFVCQSSNRKGFCNVSQV